MQNAAQIDAFQSLVTRYEALTRVQELVRGYRSAQARAGAGAKARLNVWAGPDLLRHDEVSLCRVLTWFLDPAANHDLGHHFLASFLSKLVGLKLPTWGGRVEVSREYRKGDSRIDILVQLRTLTVGIEAKVRSTPCLEQLERYREAFRSTEFRGVLLVRRCEDVPPGMLQESQFQLLLWCEVEEWLRGESRELEKCQRTSELPLIPNRALVGFLASNFADAIHRIYEEIRA